MFEIDTEGSDLSVLKGAEGLLSKNAIDFLFVEVSFFAEQRHVLISEFLSYLAPFGYFVMGVYDQSLEWDGRARVQYANVLFARSGLMVRP